ncbi:MAG: hypothetical protein AAFY56_22370, partial [Pseudomonadota bacterium]
LEDVGSITPRLHKFSYVFKIIRGDHQTVRGLLDVENCPAGDGTSYKYHALRLMRQVRHECAFAAQQRRILGSR